MKRIAGILLACCLLATPLSGCRRPQPQEQAKKPAETIKFSALITDANARVVWGQDAISKEITNRTGVELQLEILSGDLTQKISTYIASGGYPDILLSVDNDNVARLAEAGALCPLDDYIEEHGTNIKAAFGDDLNKMKDEKTSRIFGLNRMYKSEPARSQAVFNVQYDVLVQEGFPKLRTLDNLYVVMKDYMAKNPSYKGEKTIGLTAWGDSYGMNVTFNNPALAAAGYQNDGNFAISDELDVKYGLTLDTTRNYFRWLNKLYREGLFDEESLVQNREQFFQKVSSGRVLAVTTEYWDINDSQAKLRKDGKPDRCYAQFPLLMDEKTESKISNYDPLGTWKSVITNNCPDTEKAFRFFDQMWSEEMQVLCNWGVEGIHYDIREGKRVMKPEMLDLRAKDPDWMSISGLQMYTFWCNGENVRDSSGQYISPFGTKEELIAGQDDATKQVLKGYGITTWKDLCPKAEPSPWGFAWTLTLPQDSTGAYAEGQANDKIRRKYLPLIILAASDEQFDTQWALFKKEVYDAGISSREQEIRTALNKRLDIWK